MLIAGEPFKKDNFERDRLGVVIADVDTSTQDFLVIKNSIENCLAQLVKRIEIDEIEWSRLVENAVYVKFVDNSIQQRLYQNLNELRHVQVYPAFTTNCMVIDKWQLRKGVDAESIENYLFKLVEKGNIEPLFSSIQHEGNFMFFACFDQKCVLKLRNIIWDQFGQEIKVLLNFFDVYLKLCLIFFTLNSLKSCETLICLPPRENQKFNTPTTRPVEYHIRVTSFDTVLFYF